MEDPYQPPKDEGAVEKAPLAIWRKRSRGMVILLSAATSLTGMTLAWMAGKYSVVLQSAQDRAPAFLQESLQFAWKDPQLLFWCGAFLGSVALAFLHLEKHIAAFVLALIGAAIVGAWAGVLLMTLSHLIRSFAR